MNMEDTQSFYKGINNNEILVIPIWTKDAPCGNVLLIGYTNLRLSPLLKKKKLVKQTLLCDVGSWEQPLVYAHATLTFDFDEHLASIYS